MNNTRFDWLARSMSSRRAFNRALAGAGASLPGLRIINDVGAASCPKGKKRCGKKCIPKHRCCTTDQCRPKTSGKVCKKGRCVCPGGKTLCGKRCLLKGAACPPVPDASCEARGQMVDVFPPMRVAQTFTEPNGGRLTGASLRFRNRSTGTTGTYELRLQTVNPATGVPQETTLGVALRPSNTVSDTALTWVHFSFSNPPKLKPGRQYALVIQRFNTTDGWNTLRRTGDPCPGGQLFVSDLNGSFIPIPLPDPGIPYQTVVEP